MQCLAISTSLTANFLAPSLKQIFTHYDPDTDELRRLLDPHPHIDETNIEALIDGLVLYTEQRWESSACTLCRAPARMDQGCASCMGPLVRGR